MNFRARVRQKGGVGGGIPPADLPAEVSTQAGPSQFRSDIFKQTPPRFMAENPTPPDEFLESRQVFCLPGYLKQSFFNKGIKEVDDNEPK